MARILENEFTSFQMDDDEFTQGTLYTIMQKQVLMNLRAESAQELLALQLDPANVLKFATAHADLSGRVKLITYILDLAADSEAKMADPNHGVPR